jgi:Phd_YefM.
MPDEWNFADAKRRLSEVLTRAENEPQFINLGNSQYVVLNGDEYRRLTGKIPSLKQLILDGPDLSGIDLSRCDSLSDRL